MDYVLYMHIQHQFGKTQRGARDVRYISKADFREHYTTL